MPSCSENASDYVQDQKINDTWLFFRTDSTNQGEAARRFRNQEAVVGATLVSLPHSVNIEPLVVDNPWRGVSFYMKTFVVPSSMKGKALRLKFDGVMGKSEVWVNGDSLCSNNDGFKPFYVDFKPQAGENQICLKLDNTAHLDTCPRHGEPLIFNTSGGIYGNVWLCAIDSLSIVRNSDGAALSVQVGECNAGESSRVDVSTEILNSYSSSRRFKVEYRIMDHNGKVLSRDNQKMDVAGRKSIRITNTLDIHDVTLWDIDNPWLYTLDVRIVCNDKIIDKQVLEFGFRNINTERGSFTLNGRTRRLLGVTRVPEYPYVGLAISDKAQWRDAYKIKRAGFDLVRAGHSIPSEEFLRACDHYGIFVLTSEGQPHNHVCQLDVVDSREFGDRNDYRLALGESANVAQSEKLNQLLNASLGFSANVDIYNGMFDFNVRNQSRQEYSGLMSITRQPKFAYYLFQSQRDIDDDELQAFAEPVCYIASGWIPNVSRGVRIYSNCSKVELFLDDVSLGKQTPNGKSNLRHPSFFFDVNCVKPGTLKAIAYDEKDNPLTECVVKTPGQPVRIKIVIDESGNLISTNDVLLVHCYFLDNESNVVLSASDNVEFSVSGSAELLSPAVIKAENGVATALIRTGKSANDFTISAKCGSMYTVADK